MSEQTVQITNQRGLHARAGTAIHVQGQTQNQPGNALLGDDLTQGQPIVPKLLAGQGAERGGDPSFDIGQRQPDGLFTQIKTQ